MLSDSQIRQDVIDELEWDPSLDSRNIGVAVKDGVVTLTGTVDGYSAKLSAERATERVHGVRAVVNEIEVRLPGAMERTDADIAEAAVNALKWNTLVPEDRVKVVVDDGWVTLRGEVDWQYQREAAETAVQHIAGVKGVTNLITVKQRARPEDIQRRIEQALERSAELDAKSIHVSTTDGKVILTGTVRSWAEREEAEWAAWAAPGVTEVENRIRVDYALAA